MALLKILIFPDPRLRTVAKTVEVVDDSIKKLAQDMLETMYQGSGIGLAATQVNEHIRLIVMDLSENRDNPMIFINPTYKILENHELSCNSINFMKIKLFSKTGCFFARVQKQQRNQCFLIILEVIFVQNRIFAKRGKVPEISQNHEILQIS